MNMKAKSLAETLFDARWLSTNDADVRLDLNEPPLGLDLARALAAEQLDRCDLGDDELAAVKQALPPSLHEELERFLDGDAPTPPASLLVPSESIAVTGTSPADAPAGWSSERATQVETNLSFFSRCAAILASLGGGPRWVAAAAVLAMVFGLTAWLVLRTESAPSIQRGGGPTWASALAAAVPAERLEMWGGRAEARSLTRRLEPLGSDLSSRLDPRVVAVSLPRGGFQSGAAIGPRLILTIDGGGRFGDGVVSVVQFDLNQGWVERVGEVRTLLPGLGLAALGVDGAEFEVWFDLSEEEAEVEPTTTNPAAEPRDVWVMACGFGGTESGVLWSPEGPAAVMAGDLIATDIGMRAGLGGAPILSRSGDLLGMVVGSQADGRFAVGVSMRAVRQRLFSEAGVLRGLNGLGEG